MRDSLAWVVGVLVLAAALGTEIVVSPVLAQSKPEWTSAILTGAGCGILGQRLEG